MNQEIKNKAVKKAVIYCRVSTKEQAEEGNSLVSQERLCREYAEKEGYEITEAFIERGESAKTAHRKELQRMLTACTTKGSSITAVIAYKLDRISRNTIDYSNIKVMLKKYGVHIRSVTEFFEDTPAGRFMENIISNVGQFDNDVRTERSLGGMLEATQEGRYVWMSPVGYDNGKVGGNTNIVQNEKAPLVKETFERIAARIDGPEAVRLIMAAKGLTNRKGRPIPRSNFYRLVRNTLYKGVIKKFGKTFQGNFDAIVSEALFDDVQDVLMGRNKKMKHYLRENPDFPLRRFVENENGKQLTGYWSKGKRLKYPYYSFQQAGTTVRKHVLEEKFMAFLSQYEFDNRHLKTMRKYLLLHFEKHSENTAMERASIEKRIVEINRHVDKLIDLQASGGISLGMLTQRTKKYEEELEHLQRLLRHSPSKEFNIPDLLAFAAIALKEPHTLWEKSPFEVRKKLQVFDFPYGLFFDGANFRTPKVCNVFKIKSEYDQTFGQVVHSECTGKNTVPEPNTPPSGNFLKTKAFWELVVEDLLELQKIMDPTSSLYEEEEESDPWDYMNY